MKNILAFIAIALALPACAQDSGVQSAATRAAPSFSYDGEFSMLPVPKRLWDSPIAIARHFMGDHPESVEGRPRFEVKFAEANDGEMQMLMTAMGYLDDSVRGEQWRLTVNFAGAGWGVQKAENRYMCQRGQNAGKWVAGRCP